LTKPFIIGVDLGGTQIRAALGDSRGRLLRRVTRPTLAQEGFQAVLRRIKEAIHQAMQGTPRDSIAAIAIGAPGPLDPWEGVILAAPNLPGCKDVPLKKLIAEEFGLPTLVSNDANVAALAEQRFGAGKGLSDLIYITVSTGIGGGIITGGRLLLGAKGLAAEVGHMTLEPHGPRCNCGNVGCLEALASGPAIARRAVERIKEGVGSLIVDLVEGHLERVTAREVNLAAQQGDQLAISVFREAGFYIGVGVVNLLHLFNPAMVIIGGSVAKAGPLLFEPIRDTVRERVQPHFLVPIVPAALGDDVGLLGAIALALEQIPEGQP